MNGKIYEKGIEYIHFSWQGPELQFLVLSGEERETLGR
jgi:hypothetical protein